MFVTFAMPIAINIAVLEKIELTVQELSRGITYRGIYILILQERDGYRKLPVMVGMADAHALLRKIHPEETGGGTDVTDLMKDTTDLFDIRAEEAFISHIENGEFMAFLFFSQGADVRHIMTRAVDAVRMALTYGCPIYIRTELFERQYAREMGDGVVSFPINALSLELLEEALRTAVEDEHYELASQIRDEIKRRK